MVRGTSAQLDAPPTAPQIDCPRPTDGDALAAAPRLRVVGSVRRPHRDSDRSRLRAYAAGDESGFERLYLRHHDGLHAHCLGHLHDPGLAEDAVQEAFLRLFLRAAHGVDDSFSVTAWLSRVATHLCRAQLRDRGRTQLVDPHATAMLSIPDHHRAGQPEPALDIALARLEVQEIADTLSPRQRACLLMRELEGLTLAALAARLGITRDGVRQNCAAAQRRFLTECRRREEQGTARCESTRQAVEGIGRGRHGGPKPTSCAAPSTRSAAQPAVRAPVPRSSRGSLASGVAARPRPAAPPASSRRTTTTLTQLGRPRRPALGRPADVPDWVGTPCAEPLMARLTNPRVRTLAVFGLALAGMVVLVLLLLIAAARWR